MFSTGLDSSPLPARGLFYSLVAHMLFLLATLVVPWSYWMPSDVHLETMQHPDSPTGNAAAPEPAAHGRKQPGGPSAQRRARRSQAEQLPAKSAEAKAVQGVVYQGLQPIVSNPPHPDNYIQTIRQPDLPVRPKLPAPLPIPPMVSIAPVKPVLAAPTPQPETPHEAPPVQAVITPPLSLPQQLPKVEAPKLPLPASSAENSSLKAVATAPAQAAMPKLAPPPVAPAVAPNGTRNILVVDALPSSECHPCGHPSGRVAREPSPCRRTGSTSAGQAGGGTAAKGEPGSGSATGAGTGAPGRRAGTSQQAAGAGAPSGSGRRRRGHRDRQRQHRRRQRGGGEWLGDGNRARLRQRRCQTGQRRQSLPGHYDPGRQRRQRHGPAAESQPP